MSLGKPSDDRLYSYEEYLAFEERSPEKHLFDNGRIIPMTPAMVGGTPMHSLIGMNVGRLLGERLTGMPCRVFDSNLRVHSATKNRNMYPDVSVVCGPLEYLRNDPNTLAIVNPRVIVEVQSPSTAVYDRGEKLELYVSISSFEQYVIVEQDRPSIDVLTRQNDGAWLLTFAHGIEAVAKLPVLGIELPLKQVYAGVEFPPRDRHGIE